MKINKYIIILLIIISIISISLKVNAAAGDSYDIGMSADKTTLKAGDTVTISLRVSNINIQSGEKGIGAYQGTIVYDTNIFENLKMSSNEDWDRPAENQGKITSVRSDGKCTSEAQELAKITLKVKADAKVGETKIQISNFSASNGVENISTKDTSVTVKIEGATTGNQGGSTNGNELKLENSGNNTNKNQTTKKTDTSASNKNLPRAGVSNILVITVIVSVVLAIGCYVGYKKTY